MKKLLYLLIPFFLISCEETDPELANLGENVGVVGTWVEYADLSMPPVEDGITRLSRSEEFDPDHYGFAFFEDGTFLERKNSGWCGTPPIAYDNFEGTWNSISDTLIDITVAYWGGTLTYQMWIVSLDADQLGIRYLFEEDRVDVK